MLCEIGINLGILVPRCEANVKCPIDGTNALKLSLMANGTSADAAIRCPRTRKLWQRRVDETKQNCLQKTASGKESLTTPSKRTNDQEHRWVMGDRISDAKNLVNDVTSLLEEYSNVSDKTIQRTTEQHLAGRCLTEIDWFF